MLEQQHDHQQQVPNSAAEADERVWQERRPWPVKALTWLLFIQGIALILIGLFNVDLPAGFQQIVAETSFFASLLPLGVLALVAAISFLSPRPGAWMVGMLVQGLNLLVALLFYFRYRPDNFFLYAMMVYAIVMVIYLNYAHVPAIFHGDPAVVPEVDDE